MRSTNSLMEALAVKARADSFDSLPRFGLSIYRKNIPYWVGGNYVVERLHALQKYNRTILLGARDHFKSSPFYGLLMWELMKGVFEEEHMYFSYNADLAKKHVRRIKRQVRANPLFKYYVRDLSPGSDYIVNYENRFTGRQQLITPFGILGGFRGEHTHGILLIDDPFRDEAEKLAAANVTKINGFIRDGLMQVPTAGSPTAQLHITGTAQTQEDIFFDESLDIQNGGRYHRNIRPACSEHDLSQDILWRERWTAAMLAAKRREIGQAAFKQEFLCIPAYETQPLLSEEYLDLAIDDDLREIYDQSFLPGGVNVLGWDPAEKRHSSPIVIYHVENGIWTQIRCKFFDRAGYVQQAKWVCWAWDHYKISRGRADNTNGVLSALYENGNLPKRLELMHISGRLKQDIAHGLDSLLTENADPKGKRRIRILPNSRQRMHMLAVQADTLNAAETRDGQGKIGHGDAFWANALATSFFRIGRGKRSALTVEEDLDTAMQRDMQKGGY